MDKMRILITGNMGYVGADVVRHLRKAFVFAASCSVYGFAEDGARTEDSSLNPLTAYAHFRESGLIRLKMLNNLKNAGKVGDDVYWKQCQE